MIQHVQLSRLIEDHFPDVPELLPRFAGEGSEPVEFFEFRGEPTVLGGEVDDLLRGRRQPGRREEPAGDDDAHSGSREQTGNPHPADASAES